MLKVLLVQLPIPRLNFGQVTGNIPMGAACIKVAVSDVPGIDVEILPESVASYLGDQALTDFICQNQPDILGFSVFSWNMDRSLYLAERVKKNHLPRIVLGGPEITPENTRVRSNSIDFRVYGEGEAVFRRLLTEKRFWYEGVGSENASEIFQNASNPYLSGLLEPELEDIVLVETQRGCPYRCTFCYYNKSQKGACFKDESYLLPAFEWAIGRGIGEIYLLDPSLNVRPRMASFLKKIALINRDRRTGFYSEIRAEKVNERLANLFYEAGFTGFEVGLQSTNPKALALVSRPTDLERFLKGTEALLKKGISLSIDLIAGLPGDDIHGFMQSVDFVASHGLGEDVQVFPLSVLPGTALRRDAQKLGLRFDPHPPYTIIETPEFSKEDLMLAYDYAETRLDTVFFHMPDLDVAFRKADGPKTHPGDIRVRLGGRRYVMKVDLFLRRPISEIWRLSLRLTQPYQVLVGPEMTDPNYLVDILEILTSANPFVPFEVVFFEPQEKPRTSGLLEAIHLRRPHFLDGDLRYLYPDPGNRAALFTLISSQRRVNFKGEMKRQVFWWREGRLPDEKDLNLMEEWDGVLIDSPVSRETLIRWQDSIGRKADEDHLLGFADIDLQKRWLLLVNPDMYAAPIINAIR